MPLADVMQPAIRHATRGFTVTPYLADCIESAAPDLVQDPFAADRLVPDGTPLKAGEKLVQGDYGEALQLIAKDGEGALHGGPLGDLVVECMERSGAFIAQEGPHRLPRGRAPADPRPAIAAGRSSARRRPRPRACTSPRC